MLIFCLLLTSRTLKILLNQSEFPPATATFLKSDEIEACWLWSAAVTIKSATPLLATRSALPEKFPFSVRPFGSTAVTVIVQLAVPGAAFATGVQVPLFDNMSLTTGEVTVTGVRTLGSMGMTMSGATSITVADVDWTTIIFTAP